eukprot:5018430-Prymnesium_polylepis.1
MSTLRNSLISGGIEFYYTFVIHSLTTDTLPIRYRYTINTLLIRISDTEIYTVSAYHTSWCTRTTVQGQDQGQRQGLPQEVKITAYTSAWGGEFGLAAECCVHACLPKAVEHMEQQQRYSQDTLGDTYRRVS